MPLTIIAACLTLAAREHGVRNDAADRDDLVKLMGRTTPLRSSDVSKPLGRLQRRHQIMLVVEGGKGKCGTYRITDAGRAYLETGAKPARQPKKRPSLSTKHGALRLGSWAKSPMTGSPIAPVLPKPQQIKSVGISSGIDPRYQCDAATFKGGEFVAEWRRLTAKDNGRG